MCSKPQFLQNNLENAKYAITSGRKIGAKIYALPEDIVQVFTFVLLFHLRTRYYVKFLLEAYKFFRSNREW